MTKLAEQTYFKNISKDAIEYAIGKPFSDMDCGDLLAEIGAIMTIMPQPPAKVLDLGCGIGWTSRMFARKGYTVTGQDICEDVIRIAKKQNDIEGMNANPDFITDDYEAISYTGAFDCAIFFDCLHHAEDERSALKSVFHALKKGGICICSEPGYGHAQNANVIEHINQYGITEKSMAPLYIKRIAREVGFSRIEIFPRLRMINKLLYKPSSTITKKNIVMKYMLTKNFIRYGITFYWIAVHKYLEGIVVLTK